LTGRPSAARAVDSIPDSGARMRCTAAFQRGATGMDLAFSLRAPAAACHSRRWDLNQALPRRVLIVDNYVSAAEALAEACSDHHDVRFVGGGSAAMEMALSWRPRVMVLDIDMPAPNGLDVATMIRETSHLDPIMLIAVTGRDAAFDREEALAHGFDSYLTKPVDVDLLLTLIAGAE
jgi:CheY-like chemotaxis protein